MTLRPIPFARSTGHGKQFSRSRHRSLTRRALRRAERMLRQESRELCRAGDND